MNKHMERIRVIKEEELDKTAFVRRLADEKLTVSMSEGRRIWGHLECKSTKKKTG